MKHSKRMGYVAIETVITAALILSVGLLSIFSLSGGGSGHASRLLQRLWGDNTSGGIDNGSIVITYDSNGYPAHLGIRPSDITPENLFAWQ